MEHPGLHPPVHDVFVFSREALREVDRRAQSEYGVPSIVLMENAAIHLAEAVLDVLDDEEGPVLICAGAGNNGGDGLAAARHLANNGTRVHILLAGAPDRFKGDAATNLAIVQAMRLPLEVADAEDPGRSLQRIAEALRPLAVVDALFGTGLSGEVAGAPASLIAAINELGGSGVTVIAADLPSGLDADTGRPLGPEPEPAVRADVTVSFVGLKRGFLTLAAQPHVGDILVADIGAPMELVASLGEELPEEERPGDGHAEPARAPAGAPGGGGRGRGKGGREPPRR